MQAPGLGGANRLTQAIKLKCDIGQHGLFNRGLHLIIKMVDEDAEEIVGIHLRQQAQRLDIAPPFKGRELLFGRLRVWRQVQPRGFRPERQ